MKKIEITPLKKISVNGGDVFHGLKNSEPSFNGFGEIYYSWIEFNVIKAWKKHTKMTMNLIVPLGKVKFVFYDELNYPSYFEETIGVKNYSRITVPPGIWFGFIGKEKSKSLITNIANIEHSDNEVVKKNINELNYNW